MKRWIASVIAIAIVLGIGVTIFPAVAEDDNKMSVPVAFGRGLNTRQAGNAVNHVIIPNKIDTKLDGVVHFLVAGFHQVVVYKPGTQPEDIVPSSDPTFINDPVNRYYLGIIRQGDRGIRRLPRLTPSSRVVTLGLMLKIVWNPSRFLLWRVETFKACFSPRKQSRGSIW